MKQLPHDLKLEGALLMAVFVNSKNFNTIESLITKDYFYSEIHKDIFDSMKRVANQRQTIDQVNVMADILKNNIALKNDFIELQNYVATFNISSTCLILGQLYFQRRLVEITSAAYARSIDNADPFDLKNTLSNDILELHKEMEGNKNERTFVESVEEVEKSIDKAMETPDHISGISTGSRMLDAITGGWQNTDLIILAARPGMGKTARALNFLTAAVNSGKNCHMISLEMSEHQLILRLLASKSGIDLNDINRGRLSSYSREDITRAANYLKTLPIVVSDNARTNIYDISTKCRILKSQNKLDLLIVDYLQIVKGSKDSPKERHNLIGLFTGEFKAIAKECNIPVIVLSQLSRGNEANSDKRPDLQFLKESGSIEQDADIVAFIYRPSYYTKNDQQKERDEHFKDMPEDMYLAYSELILAKHRNGKLATVVEYFDGQTQKFIDQMYESSETKLIAPF